ncbi:MAG TPA: hypothetical protein VK900_02650 [Anaerolineales bacterium]|nr:hypothetical protein [Anaerolineales bacterium]
MAKVFNNIFVRGLRGAVGDQFVIRRTRSGKTIVANMPVFDENRVFTEAQLAHQSAFQQASAYAKASKKNPLYMERAKARNSTSYNMAIADWFGKPAILGIDPGQVIQVRAQDDTRVTRVQVTLHENGTLLEQGDALQYDDLTWIYTPAMDLSSRPGLQVEAKAFDTARNTASMSCPLP